MARREHTPWVVKYWVFLHGCPMAPTHGQGEGSWGCYVLRHFHPIRVYIPL